MALRCRKDQATLTPAERARYVAAVLAIKADGTYDRFVAEHVTFMSGAHRGPAFLPWHREYLRRFELELQRVDPQVTLPYWNWTVDNLPTSSIWDPAFLGGNGRPSDGRVMDGPFAYATGNWTLVEGDAADLPDLRRRFGLSASSLPSPADLTNALAESVYDVAPWNLLSSSGFRNRVEGWISGPQMHNRIHVWVGGSMLPMSSPNDPVFFLHHCFVDKVWADWQAAHPGLAYVPTSGAPAGHNLGDAMVPFSTGGSPVTPGSVLDHRALGYAYDTEGVCAPKLKFRDDIGTFKFRDDGTKLKFRDEIPTLKFRDDVATIKFRDDQGPGTVKFVDDQGPGTVKFIDDQGPGTLKAGDDVKLPGLDGEFGRPGALVAQPFLASTGHQSMAWAREQPAALDAAIAQSEEELLQLAATIVEMEQARRAGQLGASDIEALEGLWAQERAGRAELDQLRSATGGQG